jgi:NAD(P)-dependent dehydrogenase (short-subunit alcohol dehydrogenase family)
MTESLPRFDGKVALVTGASRGIGRTLAETLARQGAHVVAVARTKGALEELDDAMKSEGLQVSLLRLDLRDGPAIDLLGPTLYQRFQRLDILAGCAGVLGPLSPAAHVKEADWNEVLAVNVTANWRLLRTLDPILRLSPAGRVLLFTSSLAREPRGYWAPYAASKAALEALARTYADEVKTTNVRVNLIDPVRMRTRMRRKAFPGEDETTVPLPEELMPLALSLLMPEMMANGQIFTFGS